MMGGHHHSLKLVFVEQDGCWIFLSLWISVFYLIIENLNNDGKSTSGHAYQLISGMHRDWSI